MSNVVKDTDFIDNVFPDELKEIRQRRENSDNQAAGLEGPPSVEQSLSGLAISGGGIRSASFSLGVVQGLAKFGLFKNIDYLSTVSGGGYTGSCISSLLNEPENRSDGESFPLKFTTGSAEPPALTHLRNGSNYLSAGGLLGILRLPNLLLRGIVLNLLVFIPYIMFAVILTEFIYESGVEWNLLPVIVLPMVFVFLILAIIFPFAIRLFRNVFDWKKRNAFELILTVPLLLASLTLLVMPFLNITRMAIEHSSNQFVNLLESLTLSDYWNAGVVVICTAAVFMLAGKASENVSKIAGKLVLLLVGLLGPAIVFGIYLSLCLWQIDSPYLPAATASILNKAVQCNDPPCFAKEANDESAGNETAFGIRKFFSAFFSDETAPSNFSQLRYALEGRTLTVDGSTVINCVGVGCLDKTEPVNWKADQRVWILGPQKKGATDGTVMCDPLTREQVVNGEAVAQPCDYIIRGSNQYLYIKGSSLELFDGMSDWIFLSTLVFIFLFNRFFLDVNITSPHGFYRDRLSRVFLFSKEENGELIPNDKQLLSDLNRPGTTAPYHIINVALNLQGSKDPDLRGRNSDFFFFSKLYTGSDRTGYAKTKDMEQYDRHLNLGTAMAISGAAAAPNMGVTQNKSLVFIMTMLNIRLGYWLPNPARVMQDYWFKKYQLSGAKPTLVWKESLGKLDAQGSHVNLSDGGHIENLAIYPLLKRRCKFIIAIDGEADPDMGFNGLVTLMRFARIDMGVSIDIDLDKIRKNSEGLSEKRWTLGTIRYGDNEIGHLLYVKLSVSGNEPEYIRAYRQQNSAYPHESTADQFFSEAQFEAYRALGQDICEGMLGDVKELGGFAQLESLARRVSVNNGESTS